MDWMCRNGFIFGELSIFAPSCSIVDCDLWADALLFFAIPVFRHSCLCSCWGSKNITVYWCSGSRSRQKKIKCNGMIIHNTAMQGSIGIIRFFPSYDHIQSYITIKTKKLSICPNLMVSCASFVWCRCMSGLTHSCKTVNPPYSWELYDALSPNAN